MTYGALPEALPWPARLAGRIVLPPWPRLGTGVMSAGFSWKGLGMARLGRFERPARPPHPSRICEALWGPNSASRRFRPHEANPQGATP